MLAKFKKIFFSLFLIIIVVFLSALLGSYLFIARHAEIDQTQEADAVLVLGARVILADGQENACFRSRVDHGISLYHQGLIKKLVFTGGRDQSGGLSQAQSMKNIATNSGVPAKAILLEEKSKDTWENIYKAQEILIANDLNKILLVSDPYHLPRAKALADNLGLNSFVSPAGQSPCWQTGKYFSKFVFRDSLALMRDTFFRLIVRIK